MGECFAAHLLIERERKRFVLLEGGEGVLRGHDGRRKGRKRRSGGFYFNPLLLWLLWCPFESLNFSRLPGGRCVE